MDKDFYGVIDGKGNIADYKLLVEKTYKKGLNIEDHRATFRALIIAKSNIDLTEAIKDSNKSSNFLAYVGIFIGVVGLIATIIFGIIPLISCITT